MCFTISDFPKLLTVFFTGSDVISRLRDCSFEPSHSLTDYALYICYLWSALTMNMAENSPNILNSGPLPEATNGTIPENSEHMVTSVETALREAATDSDGADTTRILDVSDGVAAVEATKQSVARKDSTDKELSVPHSETLRSVVNSHMYELAFSLCNGLFLPWLDPSAMIEFNKHLESIESGTAADIDMVRAEAYGIMSSW